MLTDAHVTSPVLWRGVLIAVPIDVAFVSVLAWRVKLARFRRLKWPLAATTAVFFAAIWGIVACGYFWQPVYHYFFPEWSRWVLPPLYGLLFGCASLVSWWLALRLHGNAVVSFCLAIGLSGMLGHIWAAYRGLLDKPPMLQGASPVAAVVFSGFEFMFYSCVILSLASLWHWNKPASRG
jgi:hypothetical protein